MGSGAWFWTVVQRLELDRGSVAVMKCGELNRGWRCTVMRVFPQPSWDTPIQVRNIFDHTISFIFLNFSPQVFLFFLFLKCLLAACLTLSRLSILLWLGSFNHCIIACFLWSTKLKHTSSNHGLCCFNWCRPRLSLVEVLIFSLMFSQAPVYVLAII